MEKVMHFARMALESSNTCSQQTVKQAEFLSKETSTYHYRKKIKEMKIFEVWASKKQLEENSEIQYKRIKATEPASVLDAC